MAGGGVGRAGLAGWCGLGCLQLARYSRVYEGIMSYRSIMASVVQRHTSQQLEGRWVKLVDGGIDVYWGAAFLAV